MTDELFASLRDETVAAIAQAEKELADAKMALIDATSECEKVKSEHRATLERAQVAAGQSYDRHRALTLQTPIPVELARRIEEKFRPRLRALEGVSAQLRGRIENINWKLTGLRETLQATERAINPPPPAATAAAEEKTAAVLQDQEAAAKNGWVA